MIVSLGVSAAWWLCILLVAKTLRTILLEQRIFHMAILVFMAGISVFVLRP